MIAHLIHEYEKMILNIFNFFKTLNFKNNYFWPQISNLYIFPFVFFTTQALSSSSRGWLFLAFLSTSKPTMRCWLKFIISIRFQIKYSVLAIEAFDVLWSYFTSHPFSKKFFTTHRHKSMESVCCLLAAPPSFSSRRACLLLLLAVHLGVAPDSCSPCRPYLPGMPQRRTPHSLPAASTTHLLAALCRACRNALLLVVPTCPAVHSAASVASRASKRNSSRTSRSSVSRPPSR
jgi:hypothetical protein